MQEVIHLLLARTFVYFILALHEQNPRPLFPQALVRDAHQRLFGEILWPIRPKGSFLEQSSLLVDTLYCLVVAVWAFKALHVGIVDPSLAICHIICPSWGTRVRRPWRLVTLLLWIKQGPYGFLFIEVRHAEGVLGSRCISSRLSSARNCVVRSMGWASLGATLS